MKQGRQRGWRVMTLLVLALAIAGAAVYSWTVRHQRRPVRESRVESLPQLPEACRFEAHEGAGYIACVLDPHSVRFRLYLARPDGQVYGDVPAFLDAMARAGTVPLIAMNAGMYHADMTPVGLFVDEWRETAALELADGDGNFYLKPNGVFFIESSGRAGVMETQAYAGSGLTARLATQSGPMLVIDGEVHPKFLADGTSRYIRNGVGVRADGAVVLAISREAVSLGAFARAFRDGFGCPDALFLDGGISAFAANGQMVTGGADKAGPILAVFAK